MALFTASLQTWNGLKYPTVASLTYVKPPARGRGKIKKIKMKTKMKNKKYLRIEPETFKGWIREIMKSEGMRYAPPQVVAKEIEKRYGGLATSHLYRIRDMRLNMQDFLPREENEG